VTRPTELALGNVLAERLRQEQLVKSGVIRWTCAEPDVDDHPKLAVLGEEFGEVARNLCERLTRSHTALCLCSECVAGLHDLREELVQVAAVAVAWIEALDARP